MKRLSIAKRLALVGLVLVSAIVAIIAIQASSLSQTVVREREAKVKDMVSAVIAMAKMNEAAVASGKLGAEEARGRVVAAALGMRWGEGDYFTIYQTDGVTLAHGNPEFVGKNRIDFVDAQGVHVVRELIELGRRGGGYLDYTVPRAGRTEPSAKIGYAELFKPWDWVVTSGVYVDDIDVAVWRQLRVAGGLALIALLIASTLGLLVARGIVGPIAGMTATMGRLAEGDYSVAIEAGDRSDEIGAMARAVKIFKDAIIDRQTLAEREAAEQEARLRRTASLASLTDGFSKAFKAVGDGIAASSESVGSDSRTLTETAERTERQADAVAEASARASSNVATVAAAAEQLTASIAEINGKVLAAARASTEAVEQSDAAGETVRGLATAAERIGQVVTLINSIASQTNLLALNATIEAARAGAAGKGFAVVAAEVKGLATQTAGATGEIQAQVSAIQAETTRAVAAISHISRTILSIREITTGVAGAVEEQTAATAEISRAIQEASHGTREVAEAIGVVSSATETTGRAILSLRRTSEQLSTQARLLNTQVSDFIAKAHQA